jgi:hypothetical protein
MLRRKRPSFPMRVIYIPPSFEAMPNTPSRGDGSAGDCEVLADPGSIEIVAGTLND